MAIPTVTLVPSSTPSPLPSAAAGRLRIAYIVEGNLYVQTGNDAPLQLTNTGEDWHPRFFEDGERILFFRGRAPHALYSVHADGRQEQALVKNGDLASLYSKYGDATVIDHLYFVPNTHLVFFNTGQPDPRVLEVACVFECNEDLILLNLDTNQLKVLLPPGRAQSFEVSPDGKLVAVQAKGHIDVIDLDGRVIHRNLVTYIPTHPYDLKPGISWNSESTELIVAVPARDIYDMSGPEAFSVWRYKVDGSARSELTFDPPPLDSCCVSPDGNWFLYKYYAYPGKISEEIPGGLYLGNLHDSTSRLYAPDHLSAWSPDSQHFMYGENEMFLGSVNEDPVFIGRGRFLSWLDAESFLYFDFESRTPTIGNIRKNIAPLSIPMPPALPLGGGNAFTFILLDPSAPK